MLYNSDLIKWEEKSTDDSNNGLLQPDLEVLFFLVFDNNEITCSPGIAREEGGASNGATISSFCPQEDSQGT